MPVITISQASRQDLVALGVGRDRIHVVYCGLDRGELRPIPEAPEPTLLYLGRLKHYKRIELLLDVAESVPDAHLHLAGDGDYRDALEAEVDAPRPARARHASTATSTRPRRRACSARPGSR